jgi:hypothetical protein
MANEVQKPENGSKALNTLNYNPYEQYGDQMTMRPIVGRLLKFSKGDYLAGEDQEEIAAGTQLVVQMDQLMIGWIKWVDNKPEQQLMGPLAEGFVPARRGDLGDHDESQWEVDTSGKARDPWQFSNYVIMKEPGKPAVDDDLYTFTTSSRGGLQAMGDLCKNYGKEMRTRPDEWPVIELGVDSYQHSNKEFGRIKIPTLKIVGWESKDTWTKAPAKKAAAKKK